MTSSVHCDAPRPADCARTRLLRRRAMRAKPGEHGQATIEFMAMVPLVLGVLVAALQVMILTYTAHAAS